MTFRKYTSPSFPPDLVDQETDINSANLTGGEGIGHISTLQNDVKELMDTSFNIVTVSTIIPNNQQVTLCNNSSTATITLPKISSLIGRERSYEFIALTDSVVNIAPDTSDKIFKPNSATQTASGEALPVLYMKNDVAVFFPTSSGWRWYYKNQNNNVGTRAVFAGSANLNFGTGTAILPYNDTTSSVVNGQTYDMAGCFNTTTYTYVAKIPGYYAITASVRVSVPSSNSQEATIVIKANGTDAAVTAQYPAKTQNNDPCIVATSPEFYVPAGGTINSYFYTDPARTLYNQDGHSFFSVSLIRRYI